MAMNIVLVEPEIPQNTGNIARTCKATGSVLHIVKPMGFEIDDKKLKRAGLDYWHELDIRYYENLDDFFSKCPGTYYFCTTKAKLRHSDPVFHDGDYLVFGKESTGIDKQILKNHIDECYRIPMRSDARSLNLSNCVAIGAYECMRQIGFGGLSDREVIKGEDFLLRC